MCLASVPKESIGHKVSMKARNVSTWQSLCVRIDSDKQPYQNIGDILFYCYAIGQ